jgi:acetyl esterase/lipase
VIYSVAAAHHALPQLGARWIAMGTGEGGTAVVELAELESNVRDPNYLGSVAISRLADLREVLASESALRDKLALFLAYGVKTAYPQFDIKDILAPEAISAYQQIGQECTANAEEPGAKLPAAMLKPGWENNLFVQKYFERNRIGTRSASAPLLVIGSEGDPTLAETSKTVDRLCKQGDRVELAKYEGSDPARVIGDSARDQMSWIQSRFAGAQPRSNCSSQH